MRPPAVTSGAPAIVSGAVHEEAATQAPAAPRSRAELALLAVMLIRRREADGQEGDVTELYPDYFQSEDEREFVRSLSQAELFDAVAEQEEWLSENYRTAEGRALARENAAWARSRGTYWRSLSRTPRYDYSPPLRPQRVARARRSPRRHGGARTRDEGSEPPPAGPLARLAHALARLLLGRRP